MGKTEVLVLLLILIAWSHSQVILVPSRVVSIPEGFAAFSCRHPSEEITSIQWLLNGSAIQVDGHIGLLHLRELTEEYNSTTIQCRVSVSSGENFTSNTALLLIQGLLPPVTNMEISLINTTYIYVSWTTPFSLLRDVTYCVDVADYDSLVVVTSECGIAQTMLDIDPLPTAQAIACSLFSVTVTPMNVVGNGTAINVVRSFANEGLNISVSRVYFDGERINFQIALSAPVCTAAVTLTALYNTDTTLFIQISPSGSRKILEFSDLELGNAKHVFNAVFKLSNINGDVNQTMLLSTHAIQSIVFNSSSHLVSVEYAVGSNTRGVLILLLLLKPGERSINFSRSIYVALGKGSSTLPFPIPNNQYLTLGYDILGNGLLQTGIGYPANRDRVYPLGNYSIDPTNFRQPQSIDTECSMISQSLTITLTCACKLGIGVTGFQVIFQKINEHNYQSLFKVFVYSGSCSSAMVHQVEESGTYGVTVFPIRQQRGIIGSYVSFFQEVVVSNNSYLQTSTAILTTPNSNNLQAIITGTSIGLGCILILITASIVLGIVFIIKYHKLKPKHHNCTTADSKETEIVYEEIGDPQSSFKYTQNVVYGISTYCNKTPNC